MGKVRSATRPVERFFASPFLLLRIPPNAVTLLTLVPATVAALLAYYQDYLWAVLAGTIAAGMDFADGTVARERNLQTRFGAYLDSVVDRVVDFLFLFGLALGLNTPRVWVLFALCVLGSYGTSYAKARAYEETAAPKTAWAQLFERPERILLLGVGTFLQGVADVAGRPWPILEWTFVVFAVGSLWTFVQRIRVVRQLLSPSR